MLAVILCVFPCVRGVCRYNRRYEGTYGPAIAAGQGTFPGTDTTHGSPVAGCRVCSMSIVSLALH